MAESLLYNVAENLIMKLGSLALSEIQLLWGVDDELERLKDTVSAMEAVLLDAEEQQIKSHAVKNWVSRLKDAFYDVDDLIDEFSYETLKRQVMARDQGMRKEVRKVFSTPNQISFRLKMSHKIKEVREELQAIDADKNQFNFCERLITTRADDELRKRRESSSFIDDDEVIGRDDDKKAIMDLLLDTNAAKENNVAVIAIVGMGGLGKTAVAQSIYNNEKTTKNFELRLWVCISEEFDLKIIVAKIIESATRKKPKNLQMDSLQSELQRQIEGKKYLLIMDDVWNEDYEQWVNLKRLLISGAKGSRILITTRHQRVAETFDTTSLYPLRELDDKSAWLLFKKMALGGEESEDKVENSNNLLTIGKEIVVKLKGVPLVIRIIGRLLYAKRSELHPCSSFDYDELYRVMEQREEAQFMRSILELSYNHLHSNLKQCFLYCVLFPKGYNIQKDDVIKQWVAQGFVQSHGTLQPNDIGEDYFMELLSRSFFQDVTRNEMGEIIECKMHDCMHELACSIVENEYVYVDVDGSNMVINKRTRHISMDRSFGIKLESPESLFEAKNLRTLIIQETPDEGYQNVHIKIPSRFLRLRTLSLRFCWIEKLPTSISKLKHLRYLKIVVSELTFLPNSITELYNLETLILDHCFLLQELPRDAKNWTNLRYLSLAQNKTIKLLPESITELYNLEALILNGCESLQELPNDLQNWINLKHLDLRHCTTLTHMPKGLGQLTSLQTMNLLVLQNGNGLSELNGLNKLRGSLTIQGLKFCTAFDLEENPSNLRLKSGLQELKLDWNYIKDEPVNISLDETNDCKRVLECLQPNSNVRKIHICGYLGVRLCNWLSSKTLVQLVSINLSNCIKLKHLPKFDQFPFLKYICLTSLPCVEYIDKNDYLSSPIFFPSLEKLSLLDMPYLKGWWKGESCRESVSFPRRIVPCLSQLVINGCPRLASIPWHAPYLQSLEISCVSLQLLGMVLKMTTSLRFVYLENIPKLEYLPNGMQQFATTLQSIFIAKCLNLTILPEWISELSSLSSLRIRDCPKLTSLPEGICQLHSLQSLEIWDCFELGKRCEEGIGEDWTKISHVPVVDILQKPTPRFQR